MPEMYRRVTAEAMRVVRAALLVLAFWALWFCVPDVHAADDEPRPPCGAAPNPSYAPAGAAPAVRVWKREEAARWVPPACVDWPSLQRYRLIVALAGNFRHDGDATDLLARFGAISAMRGLHYWSVTDKVWRVLIIDAAALEGPNAKKRRPDFNPAELKNGAEVFYAQDGGRSSGAVVYRLRVLERGPNRMVIQTENVDPIRTLVLTLFPPGSLRATYFLERRAAGVWSFYGLSGIGEDASTMAGNRDAPYVNRAAAFYRYLMNVPGDRDPPAAP
jgi:Family of unknown function (DUF6675)